MKKSKQAFQWNKVTPLSKYAAMALFIALPFVGFVLGIQYQKLVSRVSQNSKNPTAYQNSKMMFSIEYPQTWSVRSVHDSPYQYNSQTKEKISVALGELALWESNDDKKNIEITTYDLNNSEHKKHFEEYLSTAEREEDVHIADKTFRKYVNVTLPANPGVTVKHDVWTLVSADKKLAARVLRGSTPGPESVLTDHQLGQILQTFTFLDQGELRGSIIKADLNTPGYWKLFKHSQLGFSFSYPPTWEVNETEAVNDGSDHGGPMYSVSGKYANSNYGYYLAVNAWDEPENYAKWISLNNGPIMPRSTLSKIGQFNTQNATYLEMTQEHPDSSTPVFDYKIYIKRNQDLYVFTFQEKDLESLMGRKDDIAKIIGSLK